MTPITDSPEPEPVFEGKYIKWMYTPIMMLVTAGTTIISGADSETAWLVETIWSSATAVFILAWFHNYYSLGPYTEDAIFSNYSIVVEVSLAGMMLTTLWGLS